MFAVCRVYVKPYNEYTLHKQYSNNRVPNINRQYFIMVVRFVFICDEIIPVDEDILYKIIIK